MNPPATRSAKPGWPMWKHRLAALAIFLACAAAWVGTALVRAKLAESAVRRRLDQYSEPVRAGITPPGRSEPDVRADLRSLLLNPFRSKPRVYLYLQGRRAAQLSL
jgi:hypothetical protein